MWLACCHHRDGVDFRENLHLCCGPSNSKYNPIFNRFKNVWDGVTRDNIRVLEVVSATEVYHERAISFIK